jgi:DNA-binding transcriptional LysR family regulator
MDFRQVQYFLSIVETGSFTAAAEYHFISQSSLSKRIIALEEELGMKLFDRSSRNVTLTNAGEAFLKHAQSISQKYQTMIFDLDSYKLEGEEVSIATIPVITEYGITNFIADFREKNPNIEINLEELDGMNICPALEEHRYDLAFTRENFLDHQKFESTLFTKDTFLVVVSKDNPLATKSEVSLQDLNNQNFIVFDKVTGLQRVIVDECSKVGYEPTIFYSSHRKISVLGLVAANIGIALTPTMIYKFHKTPEVKPIKLTETIDCNIVLIYLKNKKLNLTARALVDYIRSSASK